MANDRARQKKLEKQKAKRTDAKRAAIEQARPLTRAEIERGSGDWPLVDAYVSGDWRDLREPKLVTLLLVRRAPRHGLVGCSMLIDRTCLGVKEGFARPMAVAQIEAILARIGSVQGGMESLPLATAQAIAFHALDYAQSLGFAPHRDVPLAFLGPRPETLEETPWAHPREPIYIEGPYDDVAAIMRRLGGRGNFGVPVIDGALDRAALVAAVAKVKLALEDPAASTSDA